MAVLHPLTFFRQGETRLCVVQSTSWGMFCSLYLPANALSLSHWPDRRPPYANGLIPATALAWTKDMVKTSQVAKIA